MFGIGISLPFHAYYFINAYIIGFFDYINRENEQAYPGYGNELNALVLIRFNQDNEIDLVEMSMHMKMGKINATSMLYDRK